MREKLYKVLNRIYGILMSISFFAGVLPLIPFLFAIIVGGQLGESISVFLHKQYYPWVILIGSIAIVFGLIAMYVGKLQGLSVKNVSAEKKESQEDK
jgi:hypothetical protein